MSKTDKTKPWWVRLHDHNPVPIHDHRDGECDLTPINKSEPWWRGNGRCHWRYWWYGCCFGCGCTMCTDQYDRKQKRRKERHNARQKLRKGDWD